MGKILALMLETGEIGRFAKVGHFASYARCVDAKRLSNEKKKGSNNAKCGNPYLAWAFVTDAFSGAEDSARGSRAMRRSSSWRA